MKYLLLFVISFAYIETQARECYLSQDQSGTLFVDCRIGAVPPEYTRLCPMVGDERDGSLYKIEVYKDELSLVEQALEFVGIQSEKVKDWDGSPLEQGEQVVCTIDTDKKRAKEAARVAAEAAEKAKKDKETLDWGAACADTKDPVAVLICKERGY